MIVIESPKSAFVTKILANNRSRVVADQLLAEIDDYDERLRLLQLSIMRRTLEVAEERLSGSRFDVIKAVSDIRVEAADVNRKYRSNAVSYRKAELAVGEVAYSDVPIAEAAELVANYEVSRTHVDAARLIETADDVREYITRFKSLIDAETTSIQRRMAKLKVSTPVSGIVQWFVFENGYVEAGTIIATVSGG